MNNSMVCQMLTCCRHLPSANCAGVAAVVCWKTICSLSDSSTGMHVLTVGQARGMYELMELADNDLLDVLLGRPHTQTVTEDPQVQSVLRLFKV